MEVLLLPGKACLEQGDFRLDVVVFIWHEVLVIVVSGQVLLVLVLLHDLGEALNVLAVLDLLARGLRAHAHLVQRVRGDLESVQQVGILR